MRCQRAGRVYLAVQDGMTATQVSNTLDTHSFSGLFVGGTTGWKRMTGSFWVDFAHKRGVQCHVARTGTTRTVSWVRAIGADSLDSSLPIWSHVNLARFIQGYLQGIFPVAEPIRPPELASIKAVRNTRHNRFAPRPTVDGISMQLAFEFVPDPVAFAA